MGFILLWLFWLISFFNFIFNDFLYKSLTLNNVISISLLYFIFCSSIIFRKIDKYPLRYGGKRKLFEQDVELPSTIDCLTKEIIRIRMDVVELKQFLYRKFEDNSEYSYFERGKDNYRAYSEWAMSYPSTIKGYYINDKEKPCSILVNFNIDFVEFWNGICTLDVFDIDMFRRFHSNEFYALIEGQTVSIILFDDAEISDYSGMIQRYSAKITSIQKNTGSDIYKYIVTFEISSSDDFYESAVYRGEEFIIEAIFEELTPKYYDLDKTKLRNKKQIFERLKEYEDRN